VRIACLELLAVPMLEVAVVGLRREALERLQPRGELVQVQCLGRQVVERQL
jgi:hypothetical protein